MIRVRNPSSIGEMYIEYAGARLNIVDVQYNQLTTSEIRTDMCYEDHTKESLVIIVRLFDNIKYHLDLISRNIYSVSADGLKLEDGFLIRNKVILDKNFCFISGIISMNIDVNGELLTEKYFFKLFVLQDSYFNEHIANSDIQIDYDNFT